jgi:hypothetical protein
LKTILRRLECQPAEEGADEIMRASAEPKDLKKEIELANAS